MGAKSLIRKFGKKHTVTRSESGGSYDEITGQFVPAPRVTVEIEMAVIPVGPKSLVKHSGGDRTKRMVKIFAVDEINMKDESLMQADKIDIDGVSFVVESVEKWPGLIKAIATQENT